MPLIYRLDMIPVEIPVSTVVAIDHLGVELQRNKTSKTYVCRKNKE